MRRYQYPSYSFGLKLGSSRKYRINLISNTVYRPTFLVLKKDVSPGPVHFIDSSITYRGKDGTPQYSLHSRHKDFGKLHQPQHMYVMQLCTSELLKSPGPGAYAPEKSPPQNMIQAPSYSMGSRTRYRKRK